MSMLPKAAVAAILITTPLCAIAYSDSDVQELRAQVKALADQLKDTQVQLETLQGKLGNVLEAKAKNPAALTDGVEIARTLPESEVQPYQEPAPTKSFKTKYYVGGGVGVSMLDLSASDIRSEVTKQYIRDELLSMDSTLEIDDEEYAFKVFAGIRPSKYWGAEIGYARLGSFSVTADLPNAELEYEFTAKPRAYYLDVLGYLPLKQNLSLVGRIGTYYWENTLTAKEYMVTGFYPNRGQISRNGKEKDKGYSVKYGLGLQYDLDSDFSIRGDWERYMIGYDVDSTYIDTWTLSGAVNF